MPPRPSMISGSRLRVVTKLSDSGPRATLELAGRKVWFVRQRLGIAISGPTALYPNDPDPPEIGQWESARRITMSPFVRMGAEVFCPSPYCGLVLQGLPP
jgi:hypothetical protein